MSLLYEVQSSLENEIDELSDHMDYFSKRWGDEQLKELIINWLNTRMGGTHSVERVK